MGTIHCPFETRMGSERVVVFLSMRIFGSSARSSIWVFPNPTLMEFRFSCKPFTFPTRLRT